MSQEFRTAAKQKIASWTRPPVPQPPVISGWEPEVAETVTQAAEAVASSDIVVQSGDTLGKLGSQHGFDYNNAQIIRNSQTYNVGYGPGDINPNDIRPGDKIVPNGDAPTIDPVKQAEQVAEAEGSEQDPECTTEGCGGR